MLFKKLTVSLIVYLSFLFNLSPIFAIELYAGGESVGIVLNYEGVLITGGYTINVDNESYNPMDKDFKPSDLITKVNDTEVKSIEALTKVIENENGDITVTIKRQNDTLTKSLKIQRNGKDFTTGLYVKDSLSGIGTVTYYNPNSGKFGSLGHAMSDENQYLVNHGDLFKSTINNIEKSSLAHVGQKIGQITNVKVGTINANNNFGVYGQYDLNLQNKKIFETASQDEVQLGKAYFLTVLENDEICECEIEITDLKKQTSENEKGMTFRLVDKNIIEKTNGIVQGMSGSPIIQNNKIIGCVTHASSSNHLVGYGLYIDWMINNE